MGKLFKSASGLCDIYQTLFKRLLIDPKLGERILNLKKNLKFTFTDPKVEITVEIKDQNWKVICGPCDVKAEIKFWMTGDAAHRLWSGKVTPMSAIMSRKIRAIGPIQALTEIASIFTSSYPIYREILKEKGREDLL